MKQCLLYQNNPKMLQSGTLKSFGNLNIFHLEYEPAGSYTKGLGVFLVKQLLAPVVINLLFGLIPCELSGFNGDKDSRNWPPIPFPVLPTNINGVFSST